MSLENPHDSLTGIGTEVTVGFALWKEPQTTGVASMPGCLGATSSLVIVGVLLALVMCTMLVVDGGGGRDKPGSELLGRDVF